MSTAEPRHIFPAVATLLAHRLSSCPLPAALPIAADAAEALQRAADGKVRQAALEHFPPATPALQAQLDAFFSAPPPDLPPPARPLFDAIAAVHPQLAWRAAGGGASPILGAVELFGPDGALPCAAMRGGFYFQPPHYFYPRHQHRAEELYLTLSGTAEWFADGAPPHRAAPLAFIHHQSEQPHACRTEAAPLLAFWSWRGEISMESYRFCEDEGQSGARG